MILTLANPAFHDLTVTTFRILVASVAFAGGVRAVALTAPLQEDLNVDVREETSAETAATSTGFDLAFALEALVEAALEVTAKTSHGLASQATPNPVGVAILAESAFCGLNVSP